MNQFPHQIVRTLLLFGEAVEHHLGSCRYHKNGIIELVIDESGHPWVAANGYLAASLWAHANVPDFDDPRTMYRARVVGDQPEPATQFAWFKDDQLVETHELDTTDVLAHIPPDRRAEVAELLGNLARRSPE